MVVSNNNIAKIQHLSKSMRPSPDLRQAKAVWRAGAIAFSDKWIRTHGAVPTGEWLEVFKIFEDDDIARGIRRMTTDAEKKISAGDDEVWPPSAFEFACFCKKPKSLHFDPNSAYLPSPPAVRTEGYGTKQLATLREKFPFLRYS